MGEDRAVSDNSPDPHSGVTRRGFIVAAATLPLLAAAGRAAATTTSTPTKPPTKPGTGDATFVQHGDRTSEHVALTFHGAGTTAIGRQILATTKQLRVPVTVFAVGTWVDANPDLVKALVADGHEMANHTYTHPALRRLDRAGVAAEIAGCANALRRTTGHIGAWFRPSGTPTPTAMMLSEASKAGYPTVVGYDVDPRDYQDPGTKLVVARTLAGTKPGSIISLHFGHQGTADALDSIVAGLRKAGLRPVTVSSLLTH
jgi:peptidoglycan/xylan/chitin deacetylase (PgdA/CDA1 family)